MFGLHTHTSIFTIIMSVLLSFHCLVYYDCNCPFPSMNIGYKICFILMSSYKLCTQMENEFYIWFIDFISILTAIQKRNLSLTAGWKLRKCVFNDTQESRISSSEAVQPYACLISWPHTLIIQLHWRAGTDFLNVMYLTLFTRCGSVPWKVNRREGTHTHTQHCLNFLICFSLSLSFPEVNELLQSLWLCVTSPLLQVICWAKVNQMTRCSSLHSAACKHQLYFHWSSSCLWSITSQCIKMSYCQWTWFPYQGKDFYG